MSSPSPLDVTSTAPLEEDGAFPTSSTVPDPAGLLGTRRAVEVTVQLQQRLS